MPLDYRQYGLNKAVLIGGGYYSFEIMKYTITPNIEELEVTNINEYKEMIASITSYSWTLDLWRTPDEVYEKLFKNGSFMTPAFGAPLGQIWRPGKSEVMGNAIMQSPVSLYIWSGRVNGVGQVTGIKLTDSTALSYKIDFQSKQYGRYVMSGKAKTFNIRMYETYLDTSGPTPTYYPTF